MAPPVAGYTAWYDASQITGQADGSSLSAWPDLSASGFNLSQATGANQPTYYSSTVGKTVNGLPAVWFNGTSDRMQAASATTLQPVSVFVVAQIGSSAGTEALVGSDVAGGLELRASSGHPDLLSQFSVDIFNATGSLPVNTPFFTAVTWNGTTAVMYINSATADSSGGVPTSMGAGKIALGYDGAGVNEFLNGPICEVLIYPSVLSSADITSTYNYLNNKWLVPSAATAARAAVVAPSGAAIRSSSW